MEFLGTKRKIVIDPYDKDKIFVDGYSLDFGNINVWANTHGKAGQIVTQKEAKVNAETIASAFDVAQRYGSIDNLLKQHKDALNALKITKDFIERMVEKTEQDPILNAVINRAIKKEIKG